jgi:1-acyl-sn-glycerol-3-phosphate acyltransferase
MHRVYSMPVTRASPDISIPPPYISRIILFLARIFLRLYLFLFLGVARVFLRGEFHFFTVFKRALQGESRCILAFRHPNGGEPQLLTWFILYRLKQLAAKAGISFATRPHTVFVYGYEVLRWGGRMARLLMPRMGAMPVHHAKLDSESMARIYRAIIEGPYPLAIAPEGRVTYTSETVPPLEQGTIRIGFQAADRIVKSGKDCPVEVLPVSIHFRYGNWGKFTLEKVVKRIERYTGFCRRGRKNPDLPFTERLRRCRDHIMEVNEARYELPIDRDLPFTDRIDRLMLAGLRAAEQILRAEFRNTDAVNRFYYLRQLCWDRIFLPGQKDFSGMSAVERAVADLRAGEAWHAGRHLELADFSCYFRAPLPGDETPLDLKIEYVQNLWDFANRTMGGGYANRVMYIYPRRVIIQTAPPINLTERLPEYHRDKKTAVARAMTLLRDAYNDCIEAARRA